jgi:chromosome segregation ATPase
MTGAALNNTSTTAQTPQHTDSHDYTLLQLELSRSLRLYKQLQQRHSSVVHQLQSHITKLESTLKTQQQQSKQESESLLNNLQLQCESLVQKHDAKHAKALQELTTTHSQAQQQWLSERSELRSRCNAADAQAAASEHARITAEEQYTHNIQKLESLVKKLQSDAIEQRQVMQQMANAAQIERTNSHDKYTALQIKYDTLTQQHESLQKDHRDSVESKKQLEQQLKQQELQYQTQLNQAKSQLSASQSDVASTKSQLQQQHELIQALLVVVQLHRIVIS